MKICRHANALRYPVGPVVVSVKPATPEENARPPRLVEYDRCQDCGALNRLDGKGWIGGLA